MCLWYRFAVGINHSFGRVIGIRVRAQLMLNYQYYFHVFISSGVWCFLRAFYQCLSIALLFIRFVAPFHWYDDTNPTVHCVFSILLLSSHWTGTAANTLIKTANKDHKIRQQNGAIYSQSAARPMHLTLHWVLGTYCTLSASKAHYPRY